MPDDSTYGVVFSYAKKNLYPLFHVVADALGMVAGRVAELEQGEAMRKAARAMLRDAGHEAPTDDQVERVVDTFVQRRFTARKALAEPALVIDAPGPWTLIRKDGTEVVIGETAADGASYAEQPTLDPQRRIAAHARHLKNLDARLKRVEHEP